MESNLPYLSDTHARAIAHVAIRSAQLDHMIEITVVDMLLPKEKTAEKIVKTWQQRQQVELIGCLLHDLFPWYSDRVEKFTSRVDAARSSRNEIIHHLWGEADPDGTLSLASYRPFREPKASSRTAEWVMEVAGDLLDASMTLHYICHWCREQRIASPHERAPLLPQGNYPFPLDHDLPDKPPTPSHQK